MNANLKPTDLRLANPDRYDDETLYEVVTHNGDILGTAIKSPEGWSFEPAAFDAPMLDASSKFRLFRVIVDNL